jgi:hypothetical protein
MQDIQTSVEELHSLVEKNFKDALSQMVNEIDLSFDYIHKDIKVSLQKYVENVCNDQGELKKEMKLFLKEISMHKASLHSISTEEGKKRAKDLMFLDTIILFDGLLDFKSFHSENKNTKVTLIKYLHTMYLSSCFCNFDSLSTDCNFDTFIEGLRQCEVVPVAKASKNPRSVSQRNVNVSQRNQPKGMNDIFGKDGNMFSSLLSNPELLSMAADISRDMENENVDPMSLIASLMSGKPDGKLNNIVSNITSKLEQKINSGEINKDELEAQANSVMNNFQNSDSIPFLKNFMKK